MNLTDDPNVQGEASNEVREFQVMLELLEGNLAIAVRTYLELYPALISEDPAKQDEGLGRLRQLNAIVRTGHLQLLSNDRGGSVGAMPGVDS